MVGCPSIRNWHGSLSCRRNSNGRYAISSTKPALTSGCSIPDSTGQQSGCRDITCRGTGFPTNRRRLTLVRLQDLLAEPNRLRSHFNELVVADEFDRLLQVQNTRWTRGDASIALW